MKRDDKWPSNHQAAKFFKRPRNLFRHAALFVTYALR
jgi:hypothetical protein